MYWLVKGTPQELQLLYDIKQRLQKRHNNRPELDDLQYTNL